MNYQVFSENEWVYPDSVISGPNSAKLYSARGADVCFQVLTDRMLSGGEVLQVSARGLACETVVYQLLSAYVNQNSHAVLGTTLDYESVKDFVTRQAPFYVYDKTLEPENGKLAAGRAAFYIRLNVATDAVPGTYSGGITLQIDNETLEIPVELKIYNTQVPALRQSGFKMVNWLYYPDLAWQHGVEPWSADYFSILEAYLDQQLDMRTDVLMIPAGEPVRDEYGNIVDFDFTHAEQVGNLALKKGFRNIMGGFIARWNKWDDQEIFFLWDRKLSISSIEGYRQLKLYFSKAQACVERNGWQKEYMQCMVDEPQIPNSAAYRSLGAICRKMMPGVVINDPVEAVDIGGALDIWVLKQAFFEKHIEEYRKLQALGEEFWVYTCGFPSGKTMNRVLDLPLSVSRLPMWMCYKYDCPGFLHWGYHVHSKQFEEDTCLPNRNCGYMPAGNGFVVYPGKNGPVYSVRGHSQRTGACDYLLLQQLGQKDKTAALALVEKVCRSFDDYDPSAQKLDETRRELLEMLG